MDGITSVPVPCSSFVLFYGADSAISDTFTCHSHTALAAWLESQSDMLAGGRPLDWSHLAKLAFEGKSLNVVLESSEIFLLARLSTLVFYRQCGDSFETFEPTVHTYTDFMEHRIEEAKRDQVFS